MLTQQIECRLEPLDFGEMVYLLRRSQFVVTDLGGLQEEAPTFGKPVLILRATTERPEAVEAGCARLVGHDIETILAAMSELRNVHSLLFQSMSRVANPFGDGKSAERILDILFFPKKQKYEDFLVRGEVGGGWLGLRDGCK